MPRSRVITESMFEEAITLIDKYVSSGDSLILAKKKAFRVVGIPFRHIWKLQNFDSYKKVQFEKITKDDVYKRFNQGR